MEELKKLMKDHENSLSFEQKKEIQRMSKPEAVQYLNWLVGTNFVGTTEDWMVSVNKKAKENYRIKKVTELTPEQQFGTRPLTIREIREYILWLADRGYEGGTVSEWQKHRIIQFNTKQVRPVATSGDDNGFSVQRFED